MSLRVGPLAFDQPNDATPNVCTPWVDASRVPWLACYLVGDGGAITDGVITLETATFMTGVVADIPTVGRTTGTTINADGATAGGQTYAQFPVGAYDKVRARITTPLVGAGTVTAVFVGNGSA